MCKRIKFEGFVLLLLAFVLAIISCNKDMSHGNSPGSSPATSSTSPFIAVAVDSTGRDSIFVIQPFAYGYFRDSIDKSGLPDSVLNYLNTNYAGFTFEKAFVIKNNAGTVGGYVAIIFFNGKPVGLLFDANGNFEEVLEQRDPGDLNGDGRHHGGRYRNRNGQQQDSISVAALPSSITSYMAGNYPKDTLLRAYQNFDSTVLVISADNGLYATLFSSSGNFIKRISLSPQFAADQQIMQDSLPSNALTFLSNSFPNYVFESALSLTLNNVVQGYVVVIDADNTKYSVWFDATGKLVAIKTIW